MTVATDQTAGALLARLETLGVPSRLVGVVEGPQVVRYEVTPREDRVKMMDFTRLSRAKDLAYATEAPSVRVLAPIPGRGVVGLEVAREDRQTVTTDDLPPAWGSHEGAFGCFVGLDVEGQPMPLDLASAPHTLIAGSTGSGKSVTLNAILCALLGVLGPDRLELVLVDLKRVELAAYADLPHLVAPVASDVPEALARLRGLVAVTETRYRLMEELSARDLPECNRALERRGMEPLPRVLCVVDELAELMLASSKEVEPLLVRIAQLGRAAGVHLLLATQSPRVAVFTGLISANVPTRIGLATAKAVDSRVVLDQGGCEDLLGRGDALFSFGGLPPVRVQVPYVSSEQVAAAVERWTETA